MSSLEASLLELERGFWRASFAGDSAFFAAHLAADAVLVFGAPIGVLDRERCVEAIAQSGARDVGWTLEDVHCLRLDESVAALVYQGVVISADGAEPERERRSSVYAKRDGVWRLALHHVTKEP